MSTSVLLHAYRLHNFVTPPPVFMLLLMSKVLTVHVIELVS